MHRIVTTISAPSRRAWRDGYPGCGRGHDALALARAGWQVTAVDFTDSTQGALGGQLSRLGGRFLLQDALELPAGPSFDLVFDHTFFCAIPPALRERWGKMVAGALAPDGRAVCLVFPVGKPPSDGGPPFGMDTQGVLAALGAPFHVLQDEPALHRAPRRTFEERWVVLARAS